MLVNRTYWIDLIESAWQRRSVIWLSGVRRVGKTCLCQTLSNAEYFDCELPRVRMMMTDPQAFWEGLSGKRVVLDEIHRLGNPSELLKIAADYFPQTRVIATGSSSLGASAKFKDTLTGRKFEIWLTPMMTRDLVDFQISELSRRFLHGGLPPFFLSDTVPEREFQEWIDAYWAKDIQELFRLERRYSFQKFFELLMAQSGGIFEASSFAGPCEVSRTTISNYLKVLEATFVVHIVRPFSSNPQNEIVSAPKVYAFDTGFVCYYKGWYELRNQDMGYLWEHFVLNELHARLQSRTIHYWRDKRRHEVDFVIIRRGKKPVALECKWSVSDFDPINLRAFWRQYPDSDLRVVAADVERSFNQTFGKMTVKFMNLETLVKSF
ncbi:MAG: ATP-binding protein [Calditrichaeota bacterium]|nr:MAG: ATP-binding protein [Calditrichota bacterium]